MKIFTNIIFLAFACLTHLECAEGSGRSASNSEQDDNREHRRARPEHIQLGSQVPRNPHGRAVSRARYPSASATAVPRERSRSPFAGYPPLPSGLDFGYTRLISLKYPDHIFEFRRYVFRRDDRMRIKFEGPLRFLCIRTHQYIVLSTSDGEIFAIVENMEFLGGICDAEGKRMKVKMVGGASEQMTSGEIAETPIEPGRCIKDMFRFIIGNNDSLQILHNY